MRIDNINCSSNQYHLNNSKKVSPILSVSKNKKYKSNNNASESSEEKGFQKKLKEEMNKRK